MEQECVLSIIAGSNENERLAVILRHTDALQGSEIVLKQQSWAAGIGWFDQKSLSLEPAQLQQLKQVLGWSKAIPSQVKPSENPSILAFPEMSQVESA